MRLRLPALLLLLLLAPLAGRAQERPAPPSLFSLDGLFEVAEGYVRAELDRRLGRAESWEVRLDRDGTNFAEGRLGPLDIVGHGVRTRAGLTVERLTLRVLGAQLGPDRKSLAGDLSGTFAAEVAAADLTRFARLQAGGRYGELRVRCRRDELVLRARPELLGVEISSEVSGRPVIRRDGRVLAFRPTNMRLVGISLPDRATERLVDRFNPVVDLAELDLPLRLEEALVTRGRLELRGRLHLPAAELARADAR